MSKKQKEDKEKKKLEEITLQEGPPLANSTPIDRFRVFGYTLTGRNHLTFLPVIT